MSTHHIHSVQTMVRVTFTDGMVAAVLTQGAELSQFALTSEERQAMQLMEQQSEAIREQIGKIGRDALHDAAVKSGQRAVKAHEGPKPIIPEKERKMKSCKQVLQGLNRLVQADVVGDNPDRFVAAEFNCEELNVTVRDSDGVTRVFAVKVSDITPVDTCQEQICCTPVAVESTAAACAAGADSIADLRESHP